MKDLKMQMVVLILATVSLVCNAQKKVWNDDFEAITKIDTQQVTIAGKEFRKLITVTYSEISPELLQSEFRSKKDELQRLIEDEETNKEYSKKRIEDLRMEIDGLRTFYHSTAKAKKWEFKDAEAVPFQQTADEKFKLLKEDFLANPRRKE